MPASELGGRAAKATKRPAVSTAAVTALWRSTAAVKERLGSSAALRASMFSKDTRDFSTSLAMSLAAARDAKASIFASLKLGSQTPRYSCCNANATWVLSRRLSASAADNEPKAETYLVRNGAIPIVASFGFSCVRDMTGGVA
eukprot:scaffold259_cov252-Pinguiococcus_pyrenoidosus.AAC.24